MAPEDGGGNSQLDDDDDVGELFLLCLVVSEPAGDRRRWCIVRLAARPEGESLSFIGVVLTFREELLLSSSSASS